jgi:hypothetical protein
LQVPVEVLAKKILALEKDNNCEINDIIDLGCGEGLLFQELQKVDLRLKEHVRFVSVDHVIVDQQRRRGNGEECFECDIAALQGFYPSWKEKFNICVFCLSLMGSNYAEYIDVAFWLLEDGGDLFIADTRAHKGDINLLLDAFSERGFVARKQHVSLSPGDTFVYIHAARVKHFRVSSEMKYRFVLGSSEERKEEKLAGKRKYEET